MSLKPVLQIIGAVAVVLTLIPLIAMDYWWIRMFDFPHIQLTILTMVALITYFMRFDIKLWQDYAFVSVLIGCFVFQYLKIHSYMPYASEEVLAATNETPDLELKLYTANVFQKNKKTQLLMDDIKAKDPDILLLVETNARWRNAIVKDLPSEYNHRVEVPLDNTYGMLLYSKLKLVAPTVHYLVDDSIPSIHSKVVLRSGDSVQLYTIHPTPPMPQHNPSSSDRDAEMMKIANFSRESKLAVIVLGDFNDVAWSATTELFQNVGELLDVRRGRGFFNTFNANNPILRWPLDHVFISSEFRLKEIQLGADINSDHFPTYTNLTYEPDKKAEQQPKPPSEEQLKRAKEQANGVQKVELDM
ncbi:endonuclease/exonuclease/phosphatase family protein [Altibacter lentus]|uniref:endonuclease/exonuclease/phosphatase family protein n=1 Tax=Altibacter lentus TaxID=1223410 RepID=UPI00054FC06B|nr:endonuclease/exonuclease/phosphatase family protein [Altibacter lentus]